MTMDAEAVVLFHSPMTAAEIEAIRCRAGVDDMKEIDDADLHCWVSESGQLEYVPNARSGAFLGEPCLQERLWHVHLGGRYWTAQLARYGGNPSAYRRSMATLLAVPSVEAVWYGTSILRDGMMLTERVDLEAFPA